MPCFSHHLFNFFNCPERICREFILSWHDSDKMWVSHSLVSCCCWTLNVTWFFLWIHADSDLFLNFLPFGWCLRTPQLLPGHQQIIHINTFVLKIKKNKTTNYYGIHISVTYTQASVGFHNFFCHCLVESVHPEVHICRLEWIKISQFTYYQVVFNQK